MALDPKWLMPFWKLRELLSRVKESGLSKGDRSHFGGTSPSEASSTPEHWQRGRGEKKKKKSFEVFAFVRVVLRSEWSLMPWDGMEMRSYSFVSGAPYTRYAPLKH